LSKKVLKKGGKVITICHYALPAEMDTDFMFEWFIVSSDGERLAKIRDILADNGLKPKINDV